MNLLKVILKASLCVVCSAAVSADEAVPAKTPVKVDKSRLEQFVASQTLLDAIAYAEKNKSPEGYYFAAKLLLENPGHPLALEGSSTATPVSAKSLLEKAKGLCEPGSPLAQLVDSALQASTDTNRDRVGGPGTMTSTVSPGSTDVYKESFYVGTPACVALVGDGIADLDIYIYDPFGQLVAKDDDYTAVCRAAWVPISAGRYTIRVVNRGTYTSIYSIATN